MSLNTHSYHARYLYSLLYFIITHYKPIHGTLNIAKSEFWFDDFELDTSGANGWQIQKISGYDLPAANPLVSIDGTPKYHGPFPANHRLKRYLTCDTDGDTQLWVSMRAHYCNTENGDQLQFNVNDNSETYETYTYSEALNNGVSFGTNVPSYNNDLSYVRDTTATYYTNHASSSTEIPECSVSESSATWYSDSDYFTYFSKIEGGHEYEISIEMKMSGDQDEYLLISNIFAKCEQISTSAPTQTALPTFSAVSPTTEQPTSAPQVSTTEIETSLSTTKAITTKEQITTTDAITTAQETVTTAQEQITTVEEHITTVQEHITTVQQHATTAFGIELQDTKRSTVSADTTSIFVSDLAFEDPVIKTDPSEQPWCQNCALYVLLGCMALVICFLIFMGIACVMYRKENRKIAEKRKAQMKNEVKAVPRAQQNYYEGSERSNSSGSSDSRVINMQQENVEDGDHVNDGSRDIETISDRTSQRGSIVSDVNIMRYDEMNEHEAENPDHRKTMTPHPDLGDEETERIEEEVESEDEDESGCEYNMQGIDGMNDGDEETNPQFMAMVDNASCDHLNMDEYDFVDDSDSPC